MIKQNVLILNNKSVEHHLSTMNVGEEVGKLQEEIKRLGQIQQDGSYKVTYYNHLFILFFLNLIQVQLISIFVYCIFNFILICEGKFRILVLTIGSVE